MARTFTLRHWLAVAGVFVVVALVVASRWLNANEVGGQQPAEPFRIAGNFYYVGANDVARPWGRYKKVVASKTAKNPVGAFIDPAGYRAYIDAAEQDLRQGVVH
jgi:hypothetical protein